MIKNKKIEIKRIGTKFDSWKKIKGCNWKTILIL
jgi:hypothetical protein